MVSKNMGLNQQVRDHALASTDWRYNSIAVRLYGWFDTVNANLFEGLLPQPVIGFDRSGRIKQDGAYYFEGDGISLYYHIDLREDLSLLEQFVALIHNAVHMEQEVTMEKGSWYHKIPFRKRMASFGIKVDEKGNTTGFAPKFKTLTAQVGTLGGDIDAMLKSFTPTVEEDDPDMVFDPSDGPESGGFTVINLDEPAEPEYEQVTFNAKKPGSGTGSKMVKWSCACTNIRAAVVLNVLCQKCGEQFLITDKNVPMSMLQYAKELPF